MTARHYTTDTKQSECKQRITGLANRSTDRLQFSVEINKYTDVQTRPRPLH